MANSFAGAAPGVSSAASPREQRLILIAISVSLAIVVAGNSLLNLALPAISQDLQASGNDLLWITDSYAVMFAALLLLAGAVGDRFSRKLALMTGQILFIGSAALSVFADSVPQMIALRTMAGLGAAFVMPVTLSVITTTFPPEERRRAVGIWASVAASGGGLGALLGGVLLEFWSWQSTFVASAVLMMIGLAITVIAVPRKQVSDAARLDWIGGSLAAIGTATLVFGVIEGPHRGWTSLESAGSLLIAIVAFTAFTLWELRQEHPLLDPRLFKLRGFTTGTLSIMLQFFAAFGFFYVIVQYIQMILGFSPIQTGLSIFPMIVTMLVVAPRIDRVMNRLGVRLTGALGLGVMAGAFGFLSTLSVDSSYLPVAIGFVLLGIGFALATTPATVAIVSSLPKEKQGVASAVNDVSREIGGTLGIAILGTVLNQAYDDRMASSTAAVPAEAAAMARESLPLAMGIAQQLGDAGLQLLVDAQAAFTSGLSSAFLIGAASLLAAAMIVLVFTPKAAVVDVEVIEPEILLTGSAAD